MFRFTIRDLLGLMIVGGLACVIGNAITPSDPQGAVPAALILFTFGGTCYVGGILMSRAGRESVVRVPK